MPELPEVETVVLGLRSLVVGKKIIKITTYDDKVLPIPTDDLNNFVVNRTILKIHRRAKIILIDLDSDYTILFHLKMTGQLVFRGPNEDFGGGHPSPSLISKLPDRTTRVTFELDGNSQLFFNDMRRFGWVKVSRTESVPELESISKLGPDILKVSSHDFVELFSRRNKTVKACLLDQTITSGCGNIYADESLYLSKIDPRKKASELTANQLKELHKNLQKVVQFSIAKGGSSSRNYVDAHGRTGKYLDFAYVYQKAGQECKRCRSKIERIVVANRGTHWCEFCQVESV